MTTSAGKFLEHYEAGQERDAVAKYGHYFLGSIILSQKKGQSYIIDGQQRLTTLTLFFRLSASPPAQAYGEEPR